jgi:hypothetical protein
MERLAYRELAENLSKIDAWLTDIGLNRYDRIRIHQRNVMELVEAVDSGKLDELVSNLSEEKRRQILWSFVESIEFSDAIDALRRKGCDIPKGVLEKALKGPHDIYLEDETSNLGRNTMFEIAIAGRVAFAEPRIGGEPDVLFEFENRRMFVQCKRVLSEESISKRISEAARQLKRDLLQSSDPRDCGLIAISVSRVINPGDKMLVVTTEADLGRAMRLHIERVIRRHGPSFRNVKDPKTAGIFFHMATPAFVKEHRLLTVAQYGIVYHIRGKSDAELLRAFANVIRL